MNNKANITSFKKGHKGYKFWFGKKFSKEHKDKLKKPKSELHKEKLRKSHLGMFAEKSGNWQGGITSINAKIRASIETRLWREAVFARDNWICQKYKTKGGKLHPHHIQNFSQFPELRFAIDNGITLSEKAHQEFHRKYGIKNNTLEQILEFIK